MTFKPSTGKHGRGIKWHDKNQKWEARILINGQRVTLGYFTSVSEAEEAYNIAKAQKQNTGLNFLKPSEED